MEGTVFTYIFSRYLPHSYFKNYLPLIQNNLEMYRNLKGTVYTSLVQKNHMMCFFSFTSAQKFLVKVCWKTLNFVWVMYILYLVYLAEQNLNFHKKLFQKKPSRVQFVQIYLCNTAIFSKKKASFAKIFTKFLKCFMLQKIVLCFASNWNKFAHAILSEL